MYLFGTMSINEAAINWKVTERRDTSALIAEIICGEFERYSELLNSPKISEYDREYMSRMFAGKAEKKDNRHLSYGFLTGILRVAKESIFSGLNNLTINSY